MKRSTIQWLLLAGVFSSLWYFAINVIVPAYYPGYDLMTYTVSELSAIGSPTRAMWVPLAVMYVFFFGVFGLGVVQLGRVAPGLKVTGWIIIGYAVFNVYWPPMNMRGQPMAMTDILHIIWSIGTVGLMFVLMWRSRKLFGRGFNWFTVGCLVAFMVFGGLTFLEAPGIEANTATPFIGLWERLNIGIFLGWVIAFSILLIRLNKKSDNLLDE